MSVDPIWASPVAQRVREVVHRRIACGLSDGHTGECNGWTSAILHLMQQYGLPGGPPIVHPKDHLTRA